MPNTMKERGNEREVVTSGGGGRVRPDSFPGDRFRDGGVPVTPGPSVAAGIGVTATGDGWIHFDHTLVQDLTKRSTVEVQGTRDDGGRCVFSSEMPPVSSAASASSGYSEEIGFNPAACRYEIVSGQAAQTFYNTDFERVIVALSGLAGYAACGFDSSAATFYLAPWDLGYANGYYSWGHSNTVSGGCSDLVPFWENHGSGSSS